MSKKNRKNRQGYKPQTVKDDFKNKQTNYQSQSEIPKGLTLDAFSNVLARLGAGTPNLLDSTNYTMTRLTKNFQLLNTLYREHWVVQRLIDTVPEDMCKNWYKITSKIAPDALSRLIRMERTTQMRAKILEGLKWGRLYGGAGGIIMIDGHEDMLDQPIDLDMVMPGSFKGLIILDRWTGITPGTTLVEDINDPDFGLPEYYNITTNIFGTLKVDHTRVVRFVGKSLPYIEELTEQYWGASELEHVFEELKKRDNTSWNIAQLVFLANLRVLKMQDMGQMLSVGDSRVQEQLYNTIQAQNWLMNNMGMYLIDQKDDFATHQYSFSGLSEIYDSFMMDVAGAAEIPVTKLFGRSPAGLNATGESDLQNYYDSIEEKQEAHLRPVIDKLLPVMCMSEFGAIPDDLDYTFNPVRRPTEEERKNLGKNISDTIVNYYNSGLFSQKTALKEIRQTSDLTGIGSNITDEEIMSASGDLEAPGESLSNLIGMDIPSLLNEEQEGVENGQPTEA